MLKSIFNGVKPVYTIYKTTQIINCACAKYKPITTRLYSKESDLNLGAAGSKYKVFRDEDSEIIMDINEERFKYANLLEEEELKERNLYEGINLDRGKLGVFDIEDLVVVLQRENARNICVIAVPKDVQYVDYMCIADGKSYRHMLAIAQFVRKVYKLKRHDSDLIPKIEGEGSKDWIALDLGNIALHIFSKEARTMYDLDSLWAVGPEYDNESVKEDPVAAMLERHSIYLKDLQPAG